MGSEATVNVTTADGIRGTIDTATSPMDGSRRDVLVRLQDGRTLMTPLSELDPQVDGSFRLSLAGTDLRELDDALQTAGGRRRVVPVIEEQLLVGKREVETGRVVVRKRVIEEQQTVEQPLSEEDVIVERVPVGRLVDGDVADRQEGDTLIIPVLKEVLVVEKRLMLKEEVRITRRRTETVRRENVVVRREVVEVERVAGKSGDLGMLGTDVA